MSNHLLIETPDANLSKGMRLLIISEGKGQPSPWEKLRNQVYLGSEEFIEKVQKHLELSQIPSSQRRPVPKSLDYYEQVST
jgi:hypothetical protein